MTSHIDSVHTFATKVYFVVMFLSLIFKYRFSKALAIDSFFCKTIGFVRLSFCKDQLRYQIVLSLILVPISNFAEF